MLNNPQYEYVIQQEYRQEQEEVQLRTPEDCHRYAMFVKGNEHCINGRTYMFKDWHGNYVSTFVSQYSDIIEKNLEPGVRDAVLKLHEKGYLTFTSCQGHDDSKYRYIGVVFNTKQQKHQFMRDVRHLKCDIHWHDNAINSVERPAKPAPPWAKGNVTIHVTWDSQEHSNTPQLDRRERPYNDEELTKFWNVQMWRNYQHYEAVIFSFGYPMVEKSFWEVLHKYFFYNHYKVTSAYYDFCNKIHMLPNYEG